jgi:hypothetical protein
MDDAYQPVRQFNYTYHRQGLDIMDKSVERGKQVITEALREFEKFYRNKPDPFIHFYTIFMEAKARELINIYSESPQVEKNQIYELLSGMDPGNAQKYAALKE